RRLTVEGVAPAEAARIARATRDLTGEASASAAGQVSPDGTPAKPGPPSVRPLATATGLRRAALALDPAAVDRVLDVALAGGVVPAWTPVIAPALRSFGQQYVPAAWYIAAEHLLSGAVSAALSRVPRPPARPRIVLACAPAEQHRLPLEA